MEAESHIGPENSSTAGLTRGYPEFTELGKRIEMLRISRGVSKQHLARYAGISRQQLWRVMTGKSEMSIGLRARLAEVLKTPTLELTVELGAHTNRANSPRRTPLQASKRVSESSVPPLVPSAARSDLAAYLGNASMITQTLATLPTGDHARALKRRFLDAIEDASIDAGITLDRAFFELRRKVLSGQL